MICENIKSGPVHAQVHKTEQTSGNVRWQWKWIKPGAYKPDTTETIDAKTSCYIIPVICFPKPPDSVG